MATTDNYLRAVIFNAQLVGTISSYLSEEEIEVTYWVHRSFWGQGIATKALSLLLEEITLRPIRARAASDNSGSLRVLKKNGFRPIGTQISFAPGRGMNIEETILELT